MKKKCIPLNCCSTLLDQHLRPELFKALCDQTRLIILGRLACAKEPLTVTEIGSCCGTHISGVSRHLSILLRAGIVASEKSGREVRYRLNAGSLATFLRGLADALEACHDHFGKTST